MTNIEITNRLYAKALNRISKELPYPSLKKYKTDAIWYSIYGIVTHEGEEAAEAYVDAIEIAL